MFSLFVNVLRFLDFSLYRVYNSGYFSLYLFMINGTVPPQSIAAPWWDGNKEGGDESLCLKTFSEVLRGATGIPDG